MSALARLDGHMPLPEEAGMFDQPILQRIKAGFGPEGISLIEKGFIVNIVAVGHKRGD